MSIGKILTLFRGGLGKRTRIRDMLAQCEQERARVEITRQSPDAPHTQTDEGTHAHARQAAQKPAAAAIHEVREDDFIVHVMSPMSLPADEVVEININRPSGRGVWFSCRVLGEYGRGDNGQAGGGNRYLLALPDRVHHINYRKHVRVGLRGMPLVEVTLRSHSGAELARGLLRDISIGGACVEVESTVLLAGTPVLMLATLSEPGVPLAERARVAWVKNYWRTGRSMVGIAFEEEVSALEPFIRHVEIRRAKRASA